MLNVTETSRPSVLFLVFVFCVLRGLLPWNIINVTVTNYWYCINKNKNKPKQHIWQMVTGDGTIYEKKNRLGRYFQLKAKRRVKQCTNDGLNENIMRNKILLSKIPSLQQWSGIIATISLRLFRWISPTKISVSQLQRSLDFVRYFQALKAQLWKSISPNDSSLASRWRLYRMWEHIWAQNETVCYKHFSLVWGCKSQKRNATVVPLSSTTAVRPKHE